MNRLLCILRAALVASAAGIPVLAHAAPTASNHWSKAEAKAWYAKQPWLVGSNYIPADAINQLEMWQGATFDPNRIDLELGWPRHWA